MNITKCMDRYKLLVRRLHGLDVRAGKGGGSGDASSAQRSSGSMSSGVLRLGGLCQSCLSRDPHFVRRTETATVGLVAEFICLQVHRTPLTARRRFAARTVQNPTRDAVRTERDQIRSIAIRTGTRQIASTAFRALDAVTNAKHEGRRHASCVPCPQDLRETTGRSCQNCRPGDSRTIS
jgi:hypothetical protein